MCKNNEFTGLFARAKHFISESFQFRILQGDEIKMFQHLVFKDFIMALV